MTSSDFRQCAAIRPDGQRCRRTARRGSVFCHSHRQAHRPSTPEERLQRHCFQCDDCGRLQPPGRILATNSRQVLLCEPCFRLRCQIEKRINELTAGGTRRLGEICSDLEGFGVDRDLVEAAISRMLADKRLVRNPGAGR